MERLPVAIEIPYCDPLLAFSLFAEDPYSAFLDSPENKGRFAYIATEPTSIISACYASLDNSWPQLEAALADFKLAPDQSLPPFQTGMIGYFGYGLGRHLERLPAPQEAGDSLPEFTVGLYDVIAAFDTVERRGWVISSGYPETHEKLRRAVAEQRANKMIARIALAPATLPPPPAATALWEPELSRAHYESKVDQIIEYVRAGDIFQANLTQRFLCTKPDDLKPFDAYRRLRKESPAPYAAYLACGEGQFVLSASPEQFLCLNSDRTVHTQPIKGSRPRSMCLLEDKAFAEELLNSPKDYAENLMIVDLLRNDLARVCQVGSVEVPSLCQLESFADMHHLVSTVTGKLKADESALSLLQACFPGGSVSGAPKIRAMEIIHELEPARRGAYCGSIGWIGFDGAMETNIVIRTLIIDRGKVIAQAGSGIIADSDKAEEYEESISKAAALLRCLDPEGRSEL
ncbi:MAG: aminodeoxychorismate synthase, component I [Rhodospirillaceae bacterium]|nr:aminodeoxychorismate synthase, component I [Rhodospirillaceae bacterium]